MSSRGAVTENGHVTTSEYENVEEVYDAKVLVGKDGRHGLPDYSHSSNRKYIKENRDGTFREMRDYDKMGHPIIEIGYHPEPQLTGNRHEKVLHYHLFEENLDRVMGGEISPTKNADIYYKYRKYLGAYGL